MAKTMKAVRYHQPGPSSVLQVEDVPIPTPGPGQILVRLHAAGLNLIDALIRTGMIPLPPPVIPGSDAAGVVEEVGSGDSQFKKGDRVIVFTGRFTPAGVSAQYFLATPENLTHLPENYTFEQGAALPLPFYTAYYNLVIRSHVTANDVVLINGASGAVGLTALEIAKSLGCKVIGVAGNPQGLDLIAKKGAVAISYKDPDFVQKVKEATGDKKAVDVILETNGSNIPKDLEVLSQGGRITLIGKPSKETVDLNTLLMKEITLMGTNLMHATPDQLKEMHAALDKALKTGIVRPEIFKTFQLNEVAQAHDELFNPAKGTAGKMILKLD